MKHLLQLGLVMATTLQAQTPLTPAKPHAFFSRTNLALFSADSLVRSLDAHTTNEILRGPTKGVENNVPFATGTDAGTWAYSLGVSGGVIGLAYLAHRTGHHKIERLIPQVDIVNDGRDVLGNYRVLRRHK